MLREELQGGDFPLSYDIYTQTMMVYLLPFNEVEGRLLLHLKEELSADPSLTVRTPVVSCTSPTASMTPIEREADSVKGAGKN